MTINAKERHETIENAYKTVENGQERSGTVRNGKRSGTVNVQERSYSTRSRFETFTKSRSRYGHGTVTFTHQKRKKHCILTFRKCSKISKSRNFLKNIEILKFRDILEDIKNSKFHKKINFEILGPKFFSKFSTLFFFADS
jgi:hypothetical protein